MTCKFLKVGFLIYVAIQYVALQTAVQADEVEMLLVKEPHSKLNPTVSPPMPGIIDPCKDEMHMLEEHETLLELQTMCSFNQRHLVSFYSRVHLANETLTLII